MTDILIAFHSHDGQTKKIADHLADRLRMQGANVERADVVGSVAPTTTKVDAP
jgi:menaquinone-dependent protoporphyrinogen IX oxidase